MVSEDPHGHFESIFDTDIKVKAGEQIALQSASFSEQINTLSIDASSNDLSFQFKSGTSVDIKLTEADYDNTNKDDLFNDITNKLNAGLVFAAGKAMGLNFLAVKDNATDKVNIGYIRSDFLDVQSRVARSQGAYGVQGGTVLMESLSRKLQSTIASTTDDRVKYYAEIPWAANGGGMMWRVQVCNFVDTGSITTNGFEIGLSNISPDDPTNGWASKTSMSNADKTYAVKYRGGGDQIQFTSTPTSGYQDSGFTPNKYDNTASDDNDIVEFHISENKLKAVRYKVVGGTSSTDEIFNIDYPQGTALYPFLILHGSVNNIKVRGAVHSIDPFMPLPSPNNDNTKDDFHIDHADMVGTAPSFNGGAGNTDNLLSMSVSLAEFFGYEANNIFGQGGANFFFEAERIFLPTLSNVSFMIELSSLQIESYNSATGQRQNIIAAVPQQVQGIQGLVEYEPNNLYFINILESTLLRTLKARILRIDGSRVLLSGLSVLTLLIK